MDFGFSEEQEMLRQSVREFLEAECPMTYVRQMMEDERGYSEEQWKKMAELGWTGLIFPRSTAAPGSTWSTWSWCSRRWARSSCRGRSSPPSILGGLAIDLGGTDEQKKRYLPGIAAGTQQGDAGAGRGERPLGRRGHRAAGEERRRRLQPVAAPSCSCTTRTTPTC